MSRYITFRSHFVFLSYCSVFPKTSIHLTELKINVTKFNKHLFNVLSPVSREKNLSGEHGDLNLDNLPMETALNTCLT